MVVHEIRAPMNSVLGFARLLAETSRFHEDCVQMIIGNAQATLRMVDDILDFACMESGTFRIHAQPFVVRSLVEGVWNLLTLSAQKKGILFKWEIATNVPEKFVGDAGRLRQVLINLANNAITFTNEGCVTMRVDFHSSRFHFSVEDTDAGIPVDELETILDPFNKCRKNGGRGLGLAISQRLVELMGGDLRVESQEGVGAKFYFSLETGLTKFTEF